MASHRFLALLFIWSLTVVGCSATPTATPTPAPTNTPAPSATPLAAASPASANTLPAPVAFALNKTQEARTMRFEFEATITEEMGGTTTVTPVLKLNGIDSTVNRHVTVTAIDSSTGDEFSYEIIIIGEDAYIKGLSDLDPQQWYSVPPEGQAGIRNLPNAFGLIVSFDPAGFGQAQFESAGTETLDDQQCSAWSAKNPEYLLDVLGVTQGSSLERQIATRDRAELKLLTCADGFIHLIDGVVEGRSTTGAADKTSLALRFHMSQLDEAFDFKAPENVQPFPTPPGQATAAPPTAAPTGAATGLPTPQATSAAPTGAATTSPTQQVTTAAPTGAATGAATTSPTQQTTSTGPTAAATSAPTVQASTPTPAAAASPTP